MSGIKKLYIVGDPGDQLANSPPVRWVIGEMENALEKHTVSVLHSGKVEHIQRDEVCVVCAGYKAESAQAILSSAGISLPNSAEALGIVPGISVLNS